MTAKRIVDVVGKRLREIDPLRWESVPVTMRTRFTNDEGSYDMRTIVHVHDALEREFNIDILDKHDLCLSIEDCFVLVNQHHDAH